MNGGKAFGVIDELKGHERESDTSSLHCKELNNLGKLSRDEAAASENVAIDSERGDALKAEKWGDTTLPDGELWCLEPM